MNVQDLRNNGYKVKVLHNRLYHGKYIWQTPADPVDYCGPISADPKGGSTTIIIDSPSGEHFEGHSICSKSDNYDKRLGVRIALGRSGVLSSLTFTPNE